MAQVITDYVWNVVGGEEHWTLFEELEDAFNWKAVTGDDDNKLFKITNNLAIRFVGFDAARQSSSQSLYAYIYIELGENQQQIFSITAYSLSSSRKFVITKGSAGDIVVQLGNSNYDFAPQSGTCIVFAVVNVQNTIDDNITGYGVYKPYISGTTSSSGNGITFADATPNYFVTDECEEISSNGLLRYTPYAINAKITALVPICSIASQCVSTSAYVALMNAVNVLQGRVKVEGKMYYTIGGIFLSESE